MTDDRDDREAIIRVTGGRPSDRDAPGVAILVTLRLVPRDRWTCFRCGWVYTGRCRPHEEFGWTVEEVGAHQWDEHRSVAPTRQDGRWEHLQRFQRQRPYTEPADMIQRDVVIWKGH